MIYDAVKVKQCAVARRLLGGWPGRILLREVQKLYYKEAYGIMYSDGLRVGQPYRYYGRR